MTRKMSDNIPPPPLSELEKPNNTLKALPPVVAGYYDKHHVYLSVMNKAFRGVYKKYKMNRRPLIVLSALGSVEYTTKRKLRYELLNWGHYVFEQIWWYLETYGFVSRYVKGKSNRHYWRVSDKGIDVLMYYSKVYEELLM